MSVDVAVFHSDEVDDRSLLAFGWYVGSFRCGVLVCDGAVGPFADESEAVKAMVAGVWLN